ncbi:MAG: carboxypeptidase-like regulatory domain-containing protein, partial [Muribaculaceae bacterium]|nr:carboxypeptidase-like regulatory domain-containing protein [Muribaculaceae bacterium]
MAALLLTPLAFAAPVTVSGTVSDPSGEVLIGVSVSVKGDQKVGTATDFDGNYTLSGIDSDATLVFSYVGFQAVEVEVKGRDRIDVTMHEDAELLDEVVVVGYGSLSRKEVSSSIVQVNRDDFVQGAMNSPMEMLTGKVAGLNVSSTAAADPNAGAALQVRGATSLSAGNGPLIVIDGVAGGDIRTVAPQDIESMSVLKDAASAAIYGTRGANGVILITTKKGSGEAGKPTITYDSYAALSFAKDKPEVLSPYEWRLARRGHDYGASTDWYDLITRNTSYDTNQYVSIDGSVANGGYYTASMNYKKANGLDIVSGREEFGGRAAVAANALDNHLRITASLNARRVNEDWGDSGMFDTALG